MNRLSTSYEQILKLLVVNVINFYQHTALRNAYFYLHWPLIFFLNPKECFMSVGPIGFFEDDDLYQYGAPTVGSLKGSEDSYDVSVIARNSRLNPSLRSVLEKAESMRIRVPMFENGRVSGSAEANVDHRGNSQAQGDVHVEKRTESGATVTGSAGGGVRKDTEGNCSGEFHAKIKVDYPFRR